jgi:hypothetical protein
LLPDFKRHDDFFERRIPRALTDAVDRAFHLSRPVLDSCQRIGDSQAKIIMTVKR